MAGKKVKAIVRPGGSVAANARRIVAAQTEAFFALERSVGQPEASTELHEMRIAAKRLRYAMELFASVLGPDVDWCIETVRSFQEIVGEIHDADVRVGMLRAYLHDRVAAEAEKLVASASEHCDDIDALKTQARAAVTAEEWVAEQVALAAAINRTLAGRNAQFTHLRERWMTWRADRLRERLNALGRPDPAPPERHAHAMPPPTPPISPIPEQAEASPV